jgi:hypothetical protein
MKVLEARVDDRGIGWAKIHLTDGSGPYLPEQVRSALVADMRSWEELMQGDLHKPYIGKDLVLRFKVNLSSLVEPKRERELKRFVKDVTAKANKLATDAYATTQGNPLDVA